MLRMGPSLPCAKGWSFLGQRTVLGPVETRVLRTSCFPGQELPSTPEQKVLGSPRITASGPQPQALSLYRGDEVIAVASMNYDPIVSKVAEVLASGRTIRKREVE